MEEHDLVGISYVEGRASKVKPGKPVYRYAFQQLVNGESLSISNHQSKDKPADIQTQYSNRQIKSNSIPK